MALFAKSAVEKGTLTGGLPDPMAKFVGRKAPAIELRMVSGVIALNLSPMMCSRLLRADRSRSGSARRVEHWSRNFRSLYQDALHAVLERRPVVYLAALFKLASCFFSCSTHPTGGWRQLMTRGLF
jgi:Cu/Ag efflux pump CusA